jgi:pyruvate dehydrogenase (quinone)/pyruvate decarboxylase
MNEHEGSLSQDVDRRRFLRLVGAGVVGGFSLTTIATAGGESADTSQPPPSTAPAAAALPDISDPDLTTADILIDTLIAWGAEFIFGVVGDGIAPVIEAIRKRADKIRYIGVRHEEAAAFMASGYAKLTGRLGACVGTTGPGAIHLMNGLYDAALDGAPVVAITGVTFHDMIGMRYIQSVNTPALMEHVALFNVQVTGPRHASLVGNRACRAAVGKRGVAHLGIPKDIQAMKISQDKASMNNGNAATSAASLPQSDAPSQAQLRLAAEALNAGSRVAVLVGQGAMAARSEVEILAEKLATPVAKALLGRAVISDDSPFSTGGIGHLGTGPSEWIMKSCDTLLILGSTMPWYEFYPKPGQARCVQVDINPDRIGLRYPAEVGLVGDVKATLGALLPLLNRKGDRGFLQEAQGRMREWDGLMAKIEAVERTPLRPQMVIRAISDSLADDAVVTFDCGANTHFAARHLRLRRDQRLVSPGMLDTMAPGLPYAIAAQCAFPDRQVVGIVGDGGCAMLMAELTTAVLHNLPIKIFVLKNNSLAQVTFEQREAGYGVFGCELSPIDFAAYAQACGAQGFRCQSSADLRSIIPSALRSPRPAVIEIEVDPAEKPELPSKVRV